jgi:hypothetical protein
MSLHVKIDFRLELLKTIWIQKILTSETEKQTKEAYNDRFKPFFESSLMKCLREFNSKNAPEGQVPEPIEVEEPAPI